MPDMLLPWNDTWGPGHTPVQRAESTISEIQHRLAQGLSPEVIIKGMCEGVGPMGREIFSRAVYENVERRERTGNNLRTINNNLRDLMADIETRDDAIELRKTIATTLGMLNGKFNLRSAKRRRLQVGPTY